MGSSGLGLILGVTAWTSVGTILGGGVESLGTGLVLGVPLLATIPVRLGEAGRVVGTTRDLD